MKANDINRFPIREYLAGMNIHPAKDRGYYGMYHSPFREDNNASMKVDYNKNLWIDYGANKGGTLIDLVMRMENCSNGEAMRLLEQQLSGTTSFSFHEDNPNRNREQGKPKEQIPGIWITEVAELHSPALLDYLRKRNIDVDIAKQFCQEIHYSTGGRNDYAIGFRNDARGYELRNENFQGSLAPKDITHIRQDESKDACYVFEGFTDYFSFLALRNKYSPTMPGINQQDYIVLNSTVNTQKGIMRLGNYEHIHCFLDNDESGRKSLKMIQDEYGLRVRDASKHYANFKDLNDYLCNRSVPKQGMKRKPGRGLKM